MRTWLIAIGLIAAAAQVGCHNDPPPRVPVPAAGYGDPSVTYDHDPMKPMPTHTHHDALRPPYDDEPLVNQRPPEQQSFVAAYRAVGSPRIAVFVNRTLEGQIIPMNGPGPANPPGDQPYLHSGQYDEAAAKSLDYEAMETILTDWLAANGQVTIVSPTMVRQKLTDEELKDLQSGRPRMLSEIAKKLDADVLVQAQAHPTQQSKEGLQIRVIADAMNTRGGESIARAVVDVPPPLDKPQINKYTRYLARKMMDDMTGTWQSPLPAPRVLAPTTRP